MNHPDPVQPFHAISISRLARDLEGQGRSIIHMEFGQPSTGAPAAAIARVQAVLTSDPGSYWESDALKARIAKLYQDRHGLGINPERIILSCGASPALVMALTAAFRPGDVIAMARPGYVAYRNNVLALSMVPLEIACGPESRYQLTAAHLAALDPAPAGVIIASPANPTGTVIARDELAAIAAVCATRGIRIISDEIYHGLSFVGPVASALEFAPNALVVNSFSKYFSMVGWRLGWLVAPDDLLGAARARMGNLFLTAPSLSQHAGLVAMDCVDELEAHIARYARNRDLMLAALPAMGLTQIAPPDGAFYIWADVRHLTDDVMDFARQLLLDTGVATAPGIDFDPVDGGHFLRFSFAVDTPLVEDAIARMIPWFQARNRRPA
ncbi:aminotransferase [Sandarakinorhabdus cyanobacteriorum]|uniref:Aminotransferase n=1 Tax=Sandarakinorhabdus cyanobacteriorum TaxID=1981098 RepID=A0A255YEJ1_9SPHN|nr:aminotransferase class I/II-fold pyridoxal phosphate-dependent enzyme [Sandarakinorhabdus cyanobacteriorum]OYQ27104.1 aminotransferase [Sandarakinorhabdus cyanobacteriorum]